ncbi:amidohydrolase [Chryseobacterium sp. A301]
MKSMHLFGLSLDIKWHDPAYNFKNIESLVENVEVDLIVLPEMFSTGFSMSPKQIADRDRSSLEWMRKLARVKNAAVCGSVAIEESNSYLNRMYFVNPEGNYAYYDKRHLFSFSGEDKIYTPGKERTIVVYKGIRFLLQVCYDLRFPVFSRYKEDYDAILYVANWPEKRVDHWQSLLKARAIENQCYVLGVNRTGMDGNDLNYVPSSYLYFADGKSIAEETKEGITGNIDLQRLQKYREHYKFLGDRDHFSIED